MTTTGMKDEIKEELLKGASPSVDGKTTVNLKELVLTAKKIDEGNELRRENNLQWEEEEWDVEEWEESG